MLFPLKLSTQKSIATFAAVIALALTTALTGCSCTKSKDGLIFRSNWTFEYNRPDKCECSDDAEGCDTPGCKQKKLFSCLAKDRDGKSTTRRYCGTLPGCSSKTPCYRTLGCGMLIESGEQTIINVAQGEGLRVCAMTPFCFPQKPCGLMPNCGKPMDGNAGIGSVNLNSHLNSHLNGQLNTQTLALGGMPAAIRSMNTAGNMPNPQVGAVPGTLVSRGIVPGASAIISGGMVAAIGVATPAGTMTPVGVRMPNGAVNNAIVLRACTMSPHCTAARPCGTTPHCGGAVAINHVANNAVALASALQAQGVASGVMQAHGGGMMMGSPMHGPMAQQQMNRQAGGAVAMGAMAMPMGQQPMNLHQMSPHPMGQMQQGQLQQGQLQQGQGQISQAQMEELAYALGLIEIEEEIEIHEERRAGRPETRSQMSVPRFHPIPSKPVFQRSEGLPGTPPNQRTLSRNEPQSEEEFEAKLDRAYLQGVSAAMDEVERKMDAKRQAAALAQLQEKILQQAENLQQQLDEQEQMQMLALQQMQYEQQIRQQQQQIQAQRQLQVQEQQRAVALAEMNAKEQSAKAAAVVQQPPRLPAKQPVVAQQGQGAQLDPLQLAGNLKTSVTNGMNEVLGPLLTSASREPTPGRAAQQAPQASPPQPQRVQSSLTAPFAALAKSEFVTELTASQPRSAPLPELPGRPPVSPVPLEYGLQPDDEDGSYILQAEFSAER